MGPYANFGGDCFGEFVSGRGDEISKVEGGLVWFWLWSLMSTRVMHFPPGPIGAPQNGKSEKYRVSHVLCSLRCLLT